VSRLKEGRIKKALSGEVDNSQNCLDARRKGGARKKHLGCAILNSARKEEAQNDARGRDGFLII